MTRPALNGGKECPDLIQLGRGDKEIVYFFFICVNHLQRYFLLALLTQIVKCAIVITVSIIVFYL